MVKIRIERDDEITLRYRWWSDVWSPALRWREDVWPVVLEWIGMAAIVCVILATGALVGFYGARPGLDSESERFADAAVNAIAPTWSKDELYSRASPELISSSSDRLGPLFDRLARIGPGARNKGCHGRSTIVPFFGSPTVTARYACEVDLSDQAAVVALSLRKDADAWTITGFYVSAPRILGP